VFAIGDANGDRHPDVVVAGPRQASLFLGTGDGGFSPRKLLDLPSPSWPTSILFGDFTSDGKIDLAVSLSVGEFIGQGVVVVFPGPLDAPGGSHEYDTVRSPGLPVVADLNHDGHSDVLVPEVPIFGYTSDSLEVFLGDGRGGLTRVPSVVTGATFVPMALGDFDGDGNLDIAARSLIEQGDSSAVSIFSGRGDGTFQYHSDLGLPMPIAGLAACDLNADGRADLVVTGYRSYPLARLETYLGRSDGTFERRDSQDLDFLPLIPQAGDLNHDGHVDILASVPSLPGVVTFFGRGDGTFAPGSTFALSFSVSALTLSDIDSDGVPDVVAGFGGSITIIHGVGDGSLGPSEQHDVEPGLSHLDENGSIRSVSLAVADFDGDGALDFAMGEPDWGAVALYVRRVDGTFTPRGGYGCGGEAGMAIGDLNEDGSPDLIVSEGPRSRLALLLNEGPTAPAAVTTIAKADSGIITVGWYVGEGVSEPATVYRAFPGGNWTSLRSLAIPSDHVVIFTDSTAVPGQPYRYRLGVWKGGMEAFSGEVVLQLPSAAAPPRALALGPTVPNPSRGSTSISYSLPSTGPVRIRVFDVTGRMVALLRQDAEPAGVHTVVWNGRDSRGRDAGSGIYFVKLDSEGQSRVRKIALTR